MLFARKKTIVVLAILLSLYGCASSGPKTKYYSLFPGDYSSANMGSVIDASFGVGPISLPEYVDHVGIVSLTGTNQIAVSGYHAWAGDLSENLSRVIAGNLGSLFNTSSVSAFPWDNRLRPNYQIKILFQEFAGVRGGEVRVKAKWSLLNQRGTEVILTGTEGLREQAQSNSYNDYVATLNRLVNKLSDNIARDIKNELAD